MRSGSLFAGVAGLDQAAAQVVDAEPAWFVENDPAASKVLAHHYPGIPNHGDITTINWDQVEPVDILTAGFPCQDISNAGRRAGIGGARSGLWTHVADAIRLLRPRYVLLENVSALVVRGLDRVLTDLAALGCDVVWTCVRASDVGAPHRRERWFAVAVPSVACGVAPNSAGDGRDEGWAESARFVGGSDAALGGGPVVADTNSEPGFERRLAAPGQAQGGGSQRDVAGRGGTGVVADSDDTGLERPEPTPRLVLPAGRAPADTDGGGCGPGQPDDGAGQPDAAGGDIDWGVYQAAIERWERILGRAAPVPTVRGARGGRKLNPALPEWMMGFPPGWITDVPGVSVNDALKLAGNAVCQQQAAAAFRWLLPLVEAERAA